MATQKPVGRAVVLVVEDDAFLQILAVDMVEEAGLVAITASNADDAVALLEDRDDVRIVFTDINMPGSMDGLKLVQAVRDRWPPIELIVTSGKVALPPHGLPDRARFFAKPYRSEEVICAMQRFAGNQPRA